MVSLRCDQQTIFNTFLKDLHVRVPSMCGTPLRLTPSPLYPLYKLHSATSENQSNLTRATPQMWHCSPFQIVSCPKTAAKDVSNGEPHPGLSKDTATTKESFHGLGCEIYY